jgi:hypothetical protein
MSERVAQPVVDNRVFHQAAVGGKTFVGSVTTDGPYISCGNDGGVALGVCGLRKFLPDDWNGKSQRGWWVVKYTNEARIDLHTWRDEHAQELSSEFGIVIIDGWPWPPEEARQEHFFTSPAWEASYSG